VGPAINAASARAAISTFMTRLHLWTIVLIWTLAPRPIGRRLGTNMSAPALPACDADHSLQNDSERFRTFRLARQREVFDCRPDGPSTRSFQAALRPV
jgi:hypothetical protein